jgi:2-phospho-L-lactate/phosphoenolpyruvate guanylyltransferase
MPTIVVPYHGAAGKSRLRSLPRDLRESLAQAMLEDVVAACLATGPTFVVSPESVAPDGAVLVHDPGRGQGAAVEAALDAAVVADARGPFIVVNADLPCLTARDLFTLAGAVPDEGLAYVPAHDGTTNALALAAPGIFEPVYGPGSADRFSALAPSRALELENIRDDVDTMGDLELLHDRLGPRTSAALRRLRAKAPA